MRPSVSAASGCSPTARALKAAARVEQVIGRNRDQDDRTIDEDVLPEEHRPDHRQVAEKRNRDRAKHRGVVEDGDTG